MVIDMTVLADRAAERLRASSDKSDGYFYSVTSQVARGTGVSNPSNLARITRDLRAALRRRSALARKARAAQRVAS